MNNENLFEQMREFKEKLDETDFSQKQKEILFQERARDLLNLNSEKYPIQEENKLKYTREMPDSFSSIVNRAGLNQHIDFVLFAAYHRIMNLDEKSVNTKDVNEEYQLARMKVSNTKVFLNNLVKRGFLMFSEKKEGLIAFTITRDGVKYVEEKLENGK